MPFLGTEKLYGQLDLGDATYSFDGVRADAEVAHLRKGVIGAKRARHGGGSRGGDALAVHPIKEEEDEITANDDDGGGVNSNNGTMLETAALIRRRRRRRQRRRRGRRQKADGDGDRGEGGIYVANRRSGHI